MALKKITEQQFLARRKDRRMVFVDAVAAIVGLLLLTASVGGVVVLDEEPVAPEWSVGMFEGSLRSARCAGGDPGRIGCTFVAYPNGDPVRTTSSSIGAPEGMELPVGFPTVTASNVTRITMTLTWIDDVPDTDEKEHQGKRYRYDENATDTLQLRVLTPWGEEQVATGTNVMPRADQQPFGQIRMQFNITELPDPPKVKAFSASEAQAELNARYNVTEHQGLGDWGAWVTVLRAGDMNGTVPANACRGYGPTGDPYEVPQEAQDAAGEAPQDPCDSDAAAERYIEGNVPQQDVAGQEGYYSTYVDKGNEWILEMKIWTYETTVSL